MDFQVEIVSEQVDEKSGEKDGKQWSIREQEAFLHKDGQKYPERFLLNLGDERPYKPGFYTIDPSCLVVGRYKDLQFTRQLELVSAEAA